MPRKQVGQIPPHVGRLQGLACRAGTPGCAIVPADWLQQLRSNVGNAKDAPPLCIAHSPDSSPSARAYPVHSQGCNSSEDTVSSKNMLFRSAQDSCSYSSPRHAAACSPVDHSAYVCSSSVTSVKQALCAGMEHEGHRGCAPTFANQAHIVETSGFTGLQDASVISVQGTCSPQRNIPPAGPIPKSEQPSWLDDSLGNDDTNYRDERQRKRLQAQMLADQIEEQKRRKEDERRQQAEEEFRDAQRLERERRELEDWYAAENSSGSPGYRRGHRLGGIAGSRAAVEAPREALQSPSTLSRRPGSLPSNAGSTARMGSSSALWVESPAISPAGSSHDQQDSLPRRRRRQRRTAATSGTAWRATECEHKNSWGNGHIDALTEESPWFSSNCQPDFDVLSTVREGSAELQRTKVRRRRCSRAREHQRDGTRRQDKDRRHAHVTGSLMDESGNVDDTHCCRGRQIHSIQASEWVPPDERASGILALVLGSLAPRNSEKDLRDQLRSLAHVCEQLLREHPEQEHPNSIKRSDLMEKARPPDTFSARGVCNTSEGEHVDLTSRSHDSPAPKLQGFSNTVHTSKAANGAEHGDPNQYWPQLQSCSLKGPIPTLEMVKGPSIASSTSQIAGGAIVDSSENHFARSRTEGSSARGHIGQGSFSDRGVLYNRSSCGKDTCGDCGNLGSCTQIGTADQTAGDHRVQHSYENGTPSQTEQTLGPPSPWPHDALDGFMMQSRTNDLSGNRENTHTNLVARKAMVGSADAGREVDSGYSGVDTLPSAFIVQNPRGMAVRRPSCRGGQSLLMSAPAVSGGGLNLQTHLPTIGREISSVCVTGL